MVCRDLGWRKVDECSGVPFYARDADGVAAAAVPQPDLEAVARLYRYGEAFEQGEEFSRPSDDYGAVRIPACYWQFPDSLHDGLSMLPQMQMAGRLLQVSEGVVERCEARRSP